MMMRHTLRWVTGCLVVGVFATGALRRVDAHGVIDGQTWLQSFDVNTGSLATTGANEFFILKPGYELTFEGKESGKRTRLVITVLDETRDIHGVDTRVVEERETVGGAVVEISRNYFAIHPQSGDVYYFGEDVDIFEHGRIASHDGSWHHGSSGQKFGLVMPGKPAVGLKFYQELAPRVAMDRAEIISLSERVATPAGTFDGCLKTRETTPLEVFSREFKLYAPGVGLVQDGSLRLVSHRYIELSSRRSASNGSAVRQ